MLLKLAWRNIWRNKRRTLITMASVFFAVVLAVIMRATNTGIYDNMIHNIVSFSSGYIQIHARGYWDERSIDNSFPESAQLYGKLSEIKEISDFTPRLESFALASCGDKTKGIMVLGIDPENEDRITGLREKLISGSYLEENGHSVLMAQGLAQDLKIKTGDTIVLISQGYHGASAAGKYRVGGIVRYGSPELNKRMLNMPLKLMQSLYGAEGRISSVSLMLRDNNTLAETGNKLKNLFARSGYEVMNWKQMMPELDQLIEGDLAGDYIVLGILYLVIAFGVFGTVLMMTRERLHEFGILLAIGMKKHLLASVLVLESFLISFIAAFAGMLAAYPLVLWFKHHPIRFSGDLQKIYDRYGMEAVVMMSDKPAVFTEQAAIVFGIAFMLSLYTLFKILSLKAIEALST